MRDKSRSAVVKSLLTILDRFLDHWSNRFESDAPVCAVGGREPVGNPLLTFACIATTAAEGNIVLGDDRGVIDYVFPTWCRFC